MGVSSTAAEEAGEGAAVVSKVEKKGGRGGWVSSSEEGVSGRGGGSGELSPRELGLLFTPHDLGRLDAYARNLVDYHLVLDLIPDAARLYFTGRLPKVHLARLQAGILLSIGLQRSDVDHVAAGLGVPGGQILALFNKSVRKISTALNYVAEKKAGAKLDAEADAATAKLSKGGAAAGGASSSAAASKGSGSAKKGTTSVSTPSMAKAMDEDEMEEDEDEAADGAMEEEEDSSSDEEEDGKGKTKGRTSEAPNPALASLMADPSMSRFAVPQDGSLDKALSGMTSKAKAHDRGGALESAGPVIPKTLSLPRQGGGSSKESKDSKEGKAASGQKHGRDSDGPRSHPDGMYGGAVDKMAAGAKKLRRG